MGRRGPLSPDRRIFFGQGRGGVHSRELASRLAASFGSRSGSSTADLLFPLLFPPTLISVTPNTGTSAGGTVVDLAGMNFVTGATVTFGGTLATGVTFVSSSHITATTPAHASGAVNVTVTNPDSQSSTLVNGFSYSAPLFVAVGPNVAATSADGIAWTSRTIPAGQYLAVGWNGSFFLAIGPNSGATATSADGITWAAGSSLPAASAAWASVAWSDTLNLWCAISSAGSGTRLVTSPDAVTWSTPTIPASVTSLSRIIWTGSLFVAVCEKATSFSTVASADGVNWTGGFPSTGVNWHGVAYNGSVITAVSDTAAFSATSIDGVNWVGHNITVGAGGPLPVITAKGAVFCANNSGTASATSPDGITWTRHDFPSSFSAAGGTSGLGLFVFVGLNKGASSPDGITWSVNAMPAGTYVAVTFKQ